MRDFQLYQKAFFKKHREQFRGVIEKYQKAGIHKHVTKKLEF